MNDTTTRPLQELLKEDSKIFQVIFAVCFVMFLFLAIVAQTLTWEWRSWLPGAEAEKSLIGGVKVGVYTFMSHLL